MATELGYYTTSEVAAHAHVDSSTVRRWVDKGLLKPSAVTPGGHYRFAPESVESLLSPERVA